MIFDCTIYSSCTYRLTICWFPSLHAILGPLNIKRLTRKFSSGEIYNEDFLGLKLYTRSVSGSGRLNPIGIHCDTWKWGSRFPSITMCIPMGSNLPLMPPLGVGISLHCLKFLLLFLKERFSFEIM